MKSLKFNTLAVGITGGIGSGKTVLCKLFSSWNVPIIYADDVANELIDSSKIIKKKIKKIFSQDVFNDDGKLNRKKVADIIFHDKTMKQKLNAIVHPYVISFIENEIKKAKKIGNFPIIGVEAALIFEAKAEKIFDYIIVVDAGKDIRIKRIMKRDKCSRTDVLSRMKSQLPTNIKIARGDFVLDNSGNLKMLKKRAIFLFQLLKRISQYN